MALEPGSNNKNYELKVYAGTSPDYTMNSPCDNAGMHTDKAYAGVYNCLVEAASYVTFTWEADGNERLEILEIRVYE